MRLLLAAYLLRVLSFLPGHLAVVQLVHDAESRADALVPAEAVQIADLPRDPLNGARGQRGLASALHQTAQEFVVLLQPLGAPLCLTQFPLLGSERAGETLDSGAIENFFHFGRVFLFIPIDNVSVLVYNRYIGAVSTTPQECFCILSRGCAYFFVLVEFERVHVIPVVFLFYINDQIKHVIINLNCLYIIVPQANARVRLSGFPRFHFAVVVPRVLHKIKDISVRSHTQSSVSSAGRGTLLPVHRLAQIILVERRIIILPALFKPRCPAAEQVAHNAGVLLHTVWP